MREIQHTIIIAEAGVNHNGDIGIAKKLIDVAADCGVDFIKFQTFKANKLVTQSAGLASYQKENLQGKGTNQLSMLESLELSEAMHHELIDYCKSKNINFLSTPFDEDSIDLLQRLGMRIGKIPSGEITNVPYLRKMAKAYPEIIMSTGMADIDEIKYALKVLLSAGTKKENITVLHCNTEYPTQMEDVNLFAMKAIKDELEVKVGYSDHTNGIEVPIAAVALGAVLIEKHFTLDRNMPGPDHKASIEPHELKELVRSVRNIEIAVSGSGIKTPSAAELKNKVIARKSIHLSTALKVGEILNESHLVMLRPGDGISPVDIEKVVGVALNKDVPAFHKLSWSDLK